VPAKIDAPFPVSAQRALNESIARALGYDFDGGRIDDAEHPFSTGHGKGDVRITTHLHERDLLGGLGSTIHETGHALYEQGLPSEHVGTTVREAASYGLHESQSRFWENYVGRSRSFATFLAPRLKEALGPGAPDADAIFAAQNRVERGLIRVMADEVTYNLHIIVRFELELALFEGTLRPEDVPAAWNEKYRTYLGIAPESDTVGCLQDVHWSAGLFGYFPSYTLGNLYAASLGATLRAAMPDMSARIERGDFSSILTWLREHVHHVGHRLEAPEIVKAAVGERDHVADLLDYLWERMGEVHGVRR
jgi:carboxypeptidase Taq